MSNFARAITILAIIVAVALCAPGPGASSEHFVVANDNIYNGNNTAAILKLGGTRADPTLPVLKSLRTGVATRPGVPAVPSIQLVHSGANFCIFAGDAVLNGNEISSFIYPGLTLVNNYSDPQVPNSDGGAIVVAAGSLLIAGYGDGSTYLGYIAVWKIGDGCTLALVNTYSTFIYLNAMAVTPDGNTLLVSYTDRPQVDSFSIDPDGTLTEHGPFGSDGIMAFGVDITADSQYAIFNVQSDNYPETYLEVEVYHINSEGSLTGAGIFGDGELGEFLPGFFIRLSPNEKFLFASAGNADDPQIVSLNFSESPLDITYNGCHTRLRTAPVYSGLMATVSPSGSGEGLYVAEYGNPVGAAALLRINPSTGCTTEVNGSPYAVDNSPYAKLNSLAVWPPRPF